MDTRTIDTYAARAEQYAASFEAVLPTDLPYLKLAATFFHARETVADIGCGSGRDAAWLQAQGFAVTGYDAVPEMLAEACRRHPGLTLAQASLPDLAEIPANVNFANILCSAVLMHLPADQHLAAAFRLADLFAPGGRLLLTYRYSQTASERDDTGRLFTSIIPGRLELLLASAGLNVVYAETQPDSRRPAIHWQTVVAEKAGPAATSAGQRGLNRLQSILVHDRKDATYKLALLRALCDISRAEASLVIWGDGQVFVPLAAVARWWLRYYWPLINSPQFIIQKRGEEHGHKPLAFRRNLQELAALYGNLFSVLRALDDDPRPLQPHLAKIAQTIRRGPVQYAGGPTQPLFTFQPDGSVPGLTGQPQGWIGIPLPVWLDLSRYEHWIRDSAIIHWAELTAEMNSAADAGPYAGLLLQTPGDQRDTDDMRQFLVRQPNLLECVWTGQSVQRRFEVDHLIPYSVWGNNDLWNLLPAHPTVNQQKGDALPTRQLVARRRDAIIGHWQAYWPVWPERFSTQLGRALTGSPTATAGWESAAFTTLQQTIERIATSRDLRRWEP